MKVLVTGAHGQLARSLQERARHHSGIEVGFLSRPSLDLLQPDSIRAAIVGAAPDVVINAAAYTAVDQAEDDAETAFRINATGAEAVAAAAASAGAAVIQVSTDYVFDGRGLRAYREDDPVNPLGVYGHSKLEGERAVRAANPRNFIVRTAWVYSSFGHNFVKSIINAAKTRDRLRVVADQFGNPTSASDLAEGLLRMLGAEDWGQTYHLAGTGSASWYEFAKEIMTHCAALGLTHVPVEPLTTDEWPTRAVRPARSTLSSEKFQADFGFTMPAWQASLRPVIEAIAALRAE